jgi:hypothetical protein
MKDEEQLSFSILVVKYDMYLEPPGILDKDLSFVD